MDKKEQYYTAKGVALLCGVSTRTVDRWKKQGLVFKRGLITLEEFEAWRNGAKSDSGSIKEGIEDSRQPQQSKGFFSV